MSAAILTTQLHLLARYQGQKWRFSSMHDVVTLTSAGLFLVQLFPNSTEGIRWLEGVMKECQKTANVDLQKLITDSENCAQCLKHLVTVETNPGRVAALEQLLLTLAHHREVLVTKKRQLETSTFSTPAGTSQMDVQNAGRVQPVEDNHTRSRLRAIEDTILHMERISFGGVAGLEQAKCALREAIVLPSKYPHLFTGGRRPWRRVLLYGPPGTGKTKLAQAVSGEIESTFYCVSSSDLISSWVGESEKIIRDLFNHARHSEGRSVIFIDEIDSVCRQRSSKEEEHTRRVKTELLRQMEGVEGEAVGDVFLLCATNCPWELDSAFLRRFQRRIHIPLPCQQARRHLLELHAAETLVSLSELEWDLLVSRTEGYSGSDIATCVADALLEPVRELEGAQFWRAGGQLFTPCPASDPRAVRCSLGDLPPHQVCPREVCVGDFLSALERSCKTVGPEDVARYEEFTRKFGQLG